MSTWVSAKGSRRALLAALLSSVLALAWLTVPASPASAAGEVTATSLGWNMLGLDSNKVTTGPNQYPIGAKACNTSAAQQTVSGTWQWERTSTSIGLAANSPVTLPVRTLKPSECTYFYWTVEVARDAASYYKSATYRIKLNYGASPGTDIFVPDATGGYRTLYVEKFVSQFRNSVTSISGPGIGRTRRSSTRARNTSTR